MSELRELVKDIIHRNIAAKYLPSKSKALTEEEEIDFWFTKLNALFVEYADEIIGKDDEVNSKKELHGWNILRAELRKKIEEFEGGEK